MCSSWKVRHSDTAVVRTSGTFSLSTTTTSAWSLWAPLQTNMALRPCRTSCHTQQPLIPSGSSAGMPATGVLHCALAPCSPVRHLLNWSTFGRCEQCYNEYEWMLSYLFKLLISLGDTLRDIRDCIFILFLFWRVLAISYGGCSNSYSYQENVKISFFLMLPALPFFTRTILTGVTRHLTVAVSSTALMIRDAENFQIPVDLV